MPNALGLMTSVVASRTTSSRSRSGKASAPLWAAASRRKQFSKGLAQLVEEGAIQVFRDPATMSQEPVLAAVGELQFDVVQYRLESEYNTQTTLRRLPYTVAGWITGNAADVVALRLPSNSRLFHDPDGRAVVLFESRWNLDYCRELNPALRFYDTCPVNRPEIERTN